MAWTYWNEKWRRAITMGVSSYLERAPRFLFPPLLHHCRIYALKTRLPKCPLSNALLCTLRLCNARSKVDNRHVVLQQTSSILVGSKVPTVPGASIPGIVTLLLGKDIVESCGTAAPQLPEEGAGGLQGRVPAGHNWPLPAASIPH